MLRSLNIRYSMSTLLLLSIQMMMIILIIINPSISSSSSSDFIPETSRPIPPTSDQNRLEEFCKILLDNFQIKNLIQSVSVKRIYDPNWPQKYRHILTLLINFQLYRIPLDQINYFSKDGFYAAKINISFLPDHQHQKHFEQKLTNIQEHMIKTNQMPSNGKYHLRLLNYFNYNGQKYQHYFFQSDLTKKISSLLMIDGKYYPLQNKPGFFPFFDNDQLYYSIDHENIKAYNESNVGAGDGIGIGIGGKLNTKFLTSPGYFLFKSYDKKTGKNITRIQFIYLNKNYGMYIIICVMFVMFFAN